MKRILYISTLAVTLAASVAFCQQATQQPPANDATSQQPSEQQGHHRHFRQFDPQKAAAHLGKRLNLSADQTAKLEPILADQQQKMTALHSDTSLTPQQRRQQARTIFQQTHEQFASILTPDQMQQLQSMRRSHGRHQPQQQSQPDSTNPPSAS